MTIRAWLQSRFSPCRRYLSLSRSPLWSRPSKHSRRKQGSMKSQTSLKLRAGELKAGCRLLNGNRCARNQVTSHERRKKVSLLFSRITRSFAVTLDCFASVLIPDSLRSESVSTSFISLDFLAQDIYECIAI